MHLRTVLPLLFLSATLHAVDWPQYRGPQGDGTTSEVVAKPWPASGPKQLWKVKSPNGFSSFAVAGQRVFTLEGRNVDGATQEVLVARDVDSGKELWTQTLGIANYGHDGGNAGTSDNKGGDGPRSTPSIYGNTVITTSAELSVQSFDIATGKVLWTRDLLKEHNGQNISWKNAASPLVEGDLVHVAGGGQGESLLALNAKDGSVAWKAFDEKITHATPVAATIGGQRQIIYFLQSGLLSVDPKSGQELWRYNFRFSVSTAASPVVWQDIVYCSAGYGVGAGAVKVSKQGDKWTATELYRKTGNKPLANHWSTPVVKDGHMYGMFQFKEYGDGPVKCVDIATGDVKWEKAGFGPGNVILAGDKVLALSDKGELVLFGADPSGYKELARADVLDGKCWTTPVLANGRIYARSTKEAVALDAR